jgi:protein-disulfide isomerase
MQQANSGSTQSSHSHGEGSALRPHRLTGLVSARGAIAQACIFVFALLAFTSASAQEPRTAPDDALVRQVTEAVIRNLQENNGQVLDKAIDQGIQRYLDRQKAAREAAIAEQARMAQEKAKKVRHPSVDRDHIRGNPKAVISLIEYSDFECPYCKHFHDTAKKLLAAHGDELNWVWRYYPLSFHNPGTQSESEAAECAAELGGEQAFWRYTDAIIARTTSGGKGFPADQLTPLATELGLDSQRFQECLDSGRHAERVAEDLKEGAAIGINGTPGNILLNNETGEVRVLSGALPQGAFEASITELLAKPVAANTRPQ